MESALDAGPTAGEPASQRKGDWSLVALLLFFYCLSFLDRNVFNLLVPAIKTSLGFTDVQISLLGGLAFAVFFALFGPIFGWLVDRAPRRAVIFGGVSVWSLSTATCGLAQNFNHLFMSRVGTGAGEAALSPAAYSMLADSFPPRRLTFALSVYACGAMVGAAAAMAVGAGAMSWLPAHGLAVPGLGLLAPWRLTFILVAIPGLLGAALIFLKREPPRRKAKGGAASWGDVGRFMRQRWRLMLGHMGGCTLSFLAGSGMTNWGPTFMVRHFHFTIPQAGLAVAVTSGVFGTLGFLVGGRVVDYMFDRGEKAAHQIYAIGLAVVATTSVVLGFTSNNPVIFLICQSVVQFAVPLSAIAPAALQIVTPPQMRGRVSSIWLLLSTLIPYSLGPTFTAALTEYVFKDPMAVGKSVAVQYGILGPLAAVLLLTAIGPMRRAVEEAKAWAVE